MSELVPRRLSGREDRLLGRELARLGTESHLQLARIGREAELQAARMEGIGEVTSMALDVVAAVSLRAAHHAEIVPSAAGRLTAIADAAAIAGIGLIHETARRMR